MRRQLASVVAAIAVTTLLVGCAAAIGQQVPAGIPTNQQGETISPTPLPPRGEQTSQPTEDISHLTGRIEVNGTLRQLSSGPSNHYIWVTRQGSLSVILHSGSGVGTVLVIATPEGFMLPEGDDPAAAFAALEELAELTGGSLQVVEIRAF
jgi:hypothetical protein